MEPRALCMLGKLSLALHCTLSLCDFDFLSLWAWTQSLVLSLWKLGSTLCPSLQAVLRCPIPWISLDAV